MGARALPPSFDNVVTRLEIDLAHGELSPYRTVLRARLWRSGDGIRGCGTLVWKHQSEVASEASEAERRWIESLAEEVSSTLGLTLESREVRNYWLRGLAARDALTPVSTRA